MEKVVCLSIEEKISLKKSLLSFIERVIDKDCSNKSREEVAILPEIIKLTAELY